MKKVFLMTALTLVVATSGCYTSRYIAGEELRGGVLNPYLWVTIPIDTLMSPYQIPSWLSDDSDPWMPWDPDVERERYYVDRPFYNESLDE